VRHDLACRGAGVVSVEAIFFDLDYTLYDQSQYLRGAFADVARAVALEVGGDGRALAASLRRVWLSAGTDHPRLFDVWLERHGLGSRERVARCVAVFHDHRPARLQLYPGADEVLRTLAGRYHLGIVTDGHAGMQHTKIEALGLADRVQTLVYCAELSRCKPDPEVFHHALGLARVSPRAAAFVGDHPVRDVAGARRAGMWAIRAMVGEFRHVPDHPEGTPHGRVRSIRGLPGMLSRCTSS
jgi:HAD superfamily hydrolase (TIGR01509 family)